MNRNAPTSSGRAKRKTEIGNLPSDWKVLTLEDVTDPDAPIRYGVVQIGPDTEDGVPIVPIRYINRIDKVRLHRASSEIESAYSGSRVQGGDVLLSVKGTIGNVGIVPSNFEGNIAREIARIRPLPNCDARFLSFQLEADHTKRRIDSKVVGSTRLEFSIHAVRDFLVALPPISEQLKIAEILGTWDEAIEKLEALRTAKERRRDVLTYSMVFGALQLSKFSCRGPTRSHHWFDLPGSWDCKLIDEVAHEASERSGDGQYEVLSCSKYDGFVRSLEYFKKQVFSSDLSGYKVIRRGEFGFPSNHVEEGSIGLQNLVDTGLVSPIYTVFRFNPDIIDNAYAFAVLKTSLYRHIYEVSTSASVDRRGSLRWSEFSKIPFPLPPLEEQRAIVKVIQGARDDVDATKREIAALKRQKRGLMQKLLTGEWRVKGISEGANG